MTSRLDRFADRDDPFWPAQLALLGAIVLQVVLPNKLIPGPDWLLPGLEGLALAALIAATPRGGRTPSRFRRGAALGLLAFVSLVTVVSIALLAHFLITGGKTSGTRLLVGGLVLWVTTVLLFGAWYWEVDRGGPLATGGERDLLFPQMATDGYEDWKPRFGDYLYVSLTNSIAFSPTDTMPLTRRAKALMALQSVSAFTTIALVIARAVNILN